MDHALCPFGGADGGYDIVDYRAIDPDCGDLNSFEPVVGEAKQPGLRVILNVILKQTSDQHP